MQVIPRSKLSGLLRAAGLDPTTRTFVSSCEPHQLTLHEAVPMPFVSGPHRKIQYPDGRVDGPYPVADRPALGNYLAGLFTALGIQSVMAVIPEGALWLNNKSQAAYLHKVEDAQRVCRFLRRRGLTDRYQGGFRILHSQFHTAIPLLAANTYAGGADVLFVALVPTPIKLTALACHHFDIHLTALDPCLLEKASDLALSQGLAVEDLGLPELSAWTDFWFENDREVE